MPRLDYDWTEQRSALRAPDGDFRRPDRGDKLRANLSDEAEA
jgi:hypothetical protein